ncbi:hypothetical protein L2E82_08990 [Cichorium intybus]|uniref:Uncharacterized protein n=1 Tax=Cichorium intybus TaxID=13427 RepID=A0ACB9G7B4_CICIN|nr:hypothetical protein L2E82_08990 [Cichorium intybus]
MSSNSSSTSSNEDNGQLNDEQFIGNIMQRTLAYYENRAGSSHVPRRRRGPNLRREREDGHDRLIHDYFVDDAVYASKFWRRFRMDKQLFLRIVGDLEARFSYFQQRWDARGVKGFTPIQKCTAAIRQLATGLGADSWDEYLRMSERTVWDALYKFSNAIIKNTKGFDENKVLPHPEPLGFETAQYRANRAEVRSRELHNNLRADLLEHVHRNAVEAIDIEEDEELFFSTDEEAEEYMDDDEDDEDDNDSYGSED